MEVIADEIAVKTTIEEERSEKNNQVLLILLIVRQIYRYPDRYT